MLECAFSAFEEIGQVLVGLGPLVLIRLNNHFESIDDSQRVGGIGFYVGEKDACIYFLLCYRALSLSLFHTPFSFHLLVKVLDDAGFGRALILVLQPQRYNLGPNAVVAQISSDAFYCLLLECWGGRML